MYINFLKVLLYIANLPVRLINKIHMKIILKKFRKVGKNLNFDVKSSILTAEYIEVGDNVFIGELAHISADLKIGNDVMFGPRSMIIGGNHYFGIKGKNVRKLHPRNRENSYLITIENQVWCGASVIILGGVVLGEGCVIGAGSVVKKSIPPYTVAVGNYCSPIKKIFNDCTLYEHLIILGMNHREATIIVDRRNEELYSLWKIKKLDDVDYTNSYWEFSDNYKTE